MTSRRRLLTLLAVSAGGFLLTEAAAAMFGQGSTIRHVLAALAAIGYIAVAVELIRIARDYLPGWTDKH